MGDKMATTRRNGQLSSCEPCRKSKLRCDHTMPICGRCTRRGLRGDCIYHPAPLTRHDLQRPSRKKIQKEGITQKYHATFQSENQGWNQKKHSVSFPGFLGNTSYSNTFNDAASEFMPFLRSQEYLKEENTVSQSESVPMDSRRVQLGAQVLTLLSNLSFYRDVVTMRFEIWEGWSFGLPLTELIFELMEEMWGDCPENAVDQNLHALKLSKEMFRTHARPFKPTPDMSWSGFKQLLSGRWEIVGLVFCITGLSTEWLSEDDAIFKRPGSTDSKSLATMASEVSDICLQFCESAGIINDIVCWLLMHHTTLLTTVYGESGRLPLLVASPERD